jgi:2-C-methyl-D-erythritol 4-phosphate cytidylyltransferase
VFKQMMPDDPIALVEGSSANVKITHVEDIFVADRLFRYRGDNHAIVHSPAALQEVLSGRTLAIFGGSYGIGAAIVELAQAFGAHTFAFSRSTTGTDVADEKCVRRALDTVASRTGAIDFVVNTAATLTRKPIETMSHDEISTAIHVNLLGTVNVATAMLPHLQKTRGSLLCFASSSYTRGRAFYSIYSATKSAVVNFCQAVAEEWSGTGVRVNCLNPERTKTPMRLRAFGAEPSESLLEPRVVAEAALGTLASPLTGQVIDVARQASSPLPAVLQHDRPSAPLCNNVASICEERERRSTRCLLRPEATEQH